MKSLSEIRYYAIQCHRITNHFYDQFPYEYHLQMAVNYGLSFQSLVPALDLDAVIGAIWCHDVIEDTRQTFNDVLEATNSLYLTEMVYAVTNEKGKNRNERANDKYYKGIADTPLAVFVKLADRMANISHSIATGSSMLNLYRKENEHFNKQLYNDADAVMFDHMNEMLKS